MIHFPIALVIAAVATEAAAVTTGDARWRRVAVTNLRIGAACAVIAAIAGWYLALDPAMESGSLLEWHRWLGTGGTATTVAAAVVSRFETRRPRVYQVALLGAGLLVGLAGHLGGVMVWGADFLRP